MHVEVKHRLARVGIRVHDEPIARFGDTFATCQLGRELGHLADKLGVRHRARGRNVLARNHEDVHRRLGIDVPESDALVRLGDERCRDLLVGNSAEEARVRHCSSVRASRARHECAQYASRNDTGSLEP